MSVTTRNPLTMVGTVMNSGFPNTREIRYTDGGELTACVWSGGLAPSTAGCTSGAVSSGNNVLIYAGAGRLHKILPHSIMTSGLGATFYDAAAPSASGVSVSGQKFIAFIPPRSRGQLALGSGSVDTVVSWQDQIVVNMPFSSGLAVSCVSGAPGFTVSFTPETNPTISQG